MRGLSSLQLNVILIVANMDAAKVVDVNVMKAGRVPDVISKVVMSVAWNMANAIMGHAFVSRDGWGNTALLVCFTKVVTTTLCTSRHNFFFTKSYA